MNKNCTSIEQSKKLIELGIDVNTADMDYVPFVNDPTEYDCVINEWNNEHEEDWIPAWSLAALISVLPRFIEFKDNKYYLRFMKEYVEYANDEVSITGRCLHTTGNNNLVDACYEMILKLRELKML